ncbi:MAG TPA: hypothetical protein VHX65_02620 [Pirellulales bacterium]|nr:hypothetical protein [Pirellulales bacterium]
MRLYTAIAWLLWIGLCSVVCAGLFAGCYSDPHFAYPHLFVPGATPQEKTAYEQNEALRFDPYPDPTLSHVDPGERPIGYEQPREPYPIRPMPAPVIVTPAPGSAGLTPVPGPATVTAPYPSNAPYPALSPSPFPAASPAPYPGAMPTPGATPSLSPVPGPAPAPYVIP